MKKAKTNRDEVRENSITVPMNAEEKAKLKKAADKWGVPMSAFVRIALKNFMAKEDL